MAARPRRIRRPLFLARSSYRRRRIRDAARILPLVGAMFLFMPILWGPDGSTGPRDTARDLVYFFAVWAGLVGAALLFSRSLGVDLADGAEDDPAEAPADRGD